MALRPPKACCLRDSGNQHEGKKGSFNHQRCIVHQVRKRLFRYGHFGGYSIIYSIILLENQVFTPDLLVGKLSNI